MCVCVCVLVWCVCVAGTHSARPSELAMALLIQMLSSLKRVPQKVMEVYSTPESLLLCLLVRRCLGLEPGPAHTLYENLRNPLQASEHGAFNFREVALLTS